MRKVVVFISIIVTTILVVLFYKPSDNTPNFYRLVSLQEYEGKLYNPKDYFDSPDTLCDNKDTLARAVVTRKNTALDVAKSLFLSKFGQKNVQKLQTSLIGDSVWKVSAIGKDTMAVYIYKSNGRILNDKTKEVNSILVDNPTLAVEIGIAYLSDIYGKETINGEYPFDVVKFQHSWLIMGTLPKGHYGGTGQIQISAYDAKVKFYIHEK